MSRNSMAPAFTRASSLLRCRSMPASQTGQRVLYQTVRRGCGMPLSYRGLSPVSSHQQRVSLQLDGSRAQGPGCRSVVEERAQLAAAARVLQLAQRLGLDLADA